jgi:hypothetical protein
MLRNIFRSINNVAFKRIKTNGICRWQYSCNGNTSGVTNMQSVHNLLTTFQVHTKHRAWEIQRIGFLCLKKQYIKFSASSCESQLRLAECPNGTPFYAMFTSIWTTNSVIVTESESESESYVTTDGQLASLSWSKTPIWGLWPDLYYMCDSYGLVLVGRPLWREVGSVLRICCWPLSSQSFSGPSPLGLETIFYCLRFETSLFVAFYDSQGYGGGIRPRLHTG